MSHSWLHPQKQSGTWHKIVFDNCGLSGGKAQTRALKMLAQGLNAGPKVAASSACWFHSQTAFLPVVQDSDSASNALGEQELLSRCSQKKPQTAHWLKGSTCPSPSQSLKPVAGPEWLRTRSHALAHHTETGEKNPREVRNYGWKEGERVLGRHRARVSQSNHHSPMKQASPIFQIWKLRPRGFTAGK